MDRERDRAHAEPPLWCEPNWDGDAIDRFYAEELRAEGYGSERHRTRAGAARAVGIYAQPWETEDELRANYDALAPYWVPYVYSSEANSAVLRELIEVVEHLAPARVLDAGCGVGLATCFLALRYPAMTVHGSDFAPAMIARAQARAQRRGLTNAAFVVATHRELPSHFQGAFFDFAFAQGALFYDGTMELEQHLSGIAGVLRPGGVFFCTMPPDVNPHVFVSVAQSSGLGLTLWAERGEVRTLTVDGEEVCWCCGFRRTGYVELAR